MRLEHLQSQTSGPYHVFNMNYTYDFMKIQQDHTPFPSQSIHIISTISDPSDKQVRLPIYNYKLSANNFLLKTPNKPWPHMRSLNAVSEGLLLQKRELRLELRY